MELKVSNLLRSRQGFTIVELLIVVVVIAILAAITIVAYNGITKQATESVLKSDLQQVSTQLEMLQAKDGTCPASSSGIKVSSNTDLRYAKISDDAYCATVQAKGQSLFLDSTSGQIEPGKCSDPPMQTFTQSACSTLAIYTGGNPTALISLTDSRGGTVRTHTVGKLADGKCWMLDNLKLGSAASAITLTPADSDVASSFTLPQLVASGTTDYDNPRVYGPVPGDTGSGATNYGYLYNWSAATAGESRISHDNTKGNAPHSICPSGWHLPTGGATGEFAWLNAKMYNPKATTPSTQSSVSYSQNWQFSGPVHGVFSSYRSNGGFEGPWGYGGFWSSSANPGSGSLNAFNANLYSGSFYVSGSGSRDTGMGIRCLLS